MFDSISSDQSPKMDSLCCCRSNEPSIGSRSISTGDTSGSSQPGAGIGIAEGIGSGETDVELRVSAAEQIQPEGDCATIQLETGADNELEL